jgi:hypothetical protein
LDVLLSTVDIRTTKPKETRRSKYERMSWKGWLWRLVSAETKRNEAAWKG